MRLDQLLVFQKKFESRSKAKIAIKEGNVSLLNGMVLQKPSLDLDEKTQLIVKNTDPYVSRGAYKLLKAIRTFNLDYSEKRVLDIGASTGGFTQVALDHGAEKVCALDVGSNQLSPMLAGDDRVEVMENYNFRYAKKSDFLQTDFDIIQCDVSFISLRYIIPPAAKFLKTNGKAVFLIKPQFEAGKKYISKHGIVRDPQVYLRVIQNVISAMKENHLVVTGLTYSPIKGQHGNIEFLVVVEKSDASGMDHSVANLNSFIRQAEENLNS